MIEDKSGNKELTFDEIREAMELGEAHWGSIHREYIDNIKFSYAYGTDQWKDDVLSYRNTAKRPSETYNIVPSFIRPFTNIIKENPPSVTIYPIAEGANKKQAKLLSGFIRAIEYQNNAQRTYTTALTNAVRGGIGGWRIIPKQNRLKRKEIDVVIEPISDFSSIMIDPNAVQPDFSDAEWFAVKTFVSKKQFEKDYPDKFVSTSSSDDRVDLVEFWVIEDDEDGEPTVNQYIITDTEICERNTSYPSNLLPICVVTGEQYTYEGHTHYGSLTQDIKAPQREINWLKSEAIATVAQAIKANVIMDNTGLNDEELEMWARAHIEPTAMLPKKGTASVDIIPPPAPPVAYMEMSAGNIEMCRQITGIYPDPTTQNGLNQQSGKAINFQQAGQATATYHFIDSLKFAIKRCGEIILDLIPSYYNDNQIRLAMGLDGQFTPISMGDQEVPDATNFDMAYGRYGVTIEAGPTYASQKEALLSMMMDLFKANPQGLSLCMDWIIKQINLPGSEELGDRFKAMLPPDVKALVDQQDGMSEDPEEQLKAVIGRFQAVSQEAEQYKGVIEQLTKALEHETAQVNSKEQEQQVQLALADKQANTQLLIEKMRLDHAKELEASKAQLEIAKAMLDKQNKDEAHMMELGSQELKHQQDLVKIEATKNAKIETDTTSHIVKAATTPKTPKTTRKNLEK